MTKQSLSKAYIETERKLINLFLRYPEVIAECIDKNITPGFFIEPHQPLVQAIYYVYGISDGKRLLTDSHYRTLLLEQGAKGDITIAMQVYHECMHGVHYSNSKENLDCLLKQLIDAHLHREGLQAMDIFNKNLGKHGYASAMQSYINRLQRTVNEAQPKSLLIHLENLVPTPVEWLWQNHFPLGKLSIIQGPPGQGKSLITLDLAARVSSGEPMPGTSATTPQGDALIASCEDGVSDTILRRLQVFPFADMSRIKCLDQSEWMDLGNLRPLKAALMALEKPRLLVFDPLSAYMGPIRTHEEGQVRRVLGPLCKLAEEMNIAVVGIMHLNKDKSKSILQRASGSVGFGAAARSVFHCATDSENRRLFAHIKSNLCPLAGSREFIVEPWEKDRELPQLKWTERVSFEDPESLFAAREAGAGEQAENWLREMLMSGEIELKELFKQARQAGISGTTLKRAKTNLGVKARKTDFKGGWAWKL